MHSIHTHTHTMSSFVKQMEALLTLQSSQIWNGEGQIECHHEKEWRIPPHTRKRKRKMAAKQTKTDALIDHIPCQVYHVARKMENN